MIILMIVILMMIIIIIIIILMIILVIKGVKLCTCAICSSEIPTHQLLLLLLI